MKRFAVAGALHLDIFADAFTSFDEGIDVEGEFKVAIGGTAFNIASFLTSMGFPSLLVSALPRGSLFTRLILSKLNHLNIKHDVLLDTGLKEPAFLALRERKDLKFAITASCVDSEQAGEFIVNAIVRDDSSDAVILDANLSAEALLEAIKLTDKAVYVHAVSEVKSLRLIPLSERRELHEKIRFVFLNLKEWQKLSETTGKKDPRQVIECGWAITKGEKGVSLYLPDGGRIIDVPAPKLEKVGSYSGLGDAFASGFAGGYEETKTLEGALKIAELMVKKKAKFAHASFVPVDISQVERELFRDKLTGAFTRSYFEEEKKYIRSAYSSYTVLMMDIDFFKKINDTYGHDVGDKVLRAVAGIIRKSVREEDLVIRYGGEEFLVLLKNGTSLSVAERIAERIRKNVESSKVEGLKVSISVGVAQHHELEKAIKLADEALYVSKRGGRNRTTVAGRAVLQKEVNNS